METAYSRALDAYLRRTEQTQAGFARATGYTQASVWQWARGHRMPGKRAARLLDDFTDGDVPFSLWKAARIERLDA
jgi:transcriptional regulator with XRE-family HTH domain